MPDRENCASAPCRLYSTDKETRVCWPSSSGVEAIGHLAFGARAGAPVAARAADDTAQRRIVALDHGRAGEAGRDRTELHRHLSLRGVGVVLGQRRPRAGRPRPRECPRTSSHTVAGGLRITKLSSKRVQPWRGSSGAATQAQASAAVASTLVGTKAASGAAAAPPRADSAAAGCRCRAPRPRSRTALTMPQIAGAPAEVAGKLDPDAAARRRPAAARTMSRAAISMPGVQKPHCSACSRENASRSSCMIGSSSKPSMVCDRRARRRRPRR